MCQNQFALAVEPVEFHRNQCSLILPSGRSSTGYSPVFTNFRAGRLQDDAKAAATDGQALAGGCHRYPGDRRCVDRRGKHNLLSLSTVFTREVLEADEYLIGVPRNKWGPSASFKL